MITTKRKIQESGSIIPSGPRKQPKIYCKYCGHEILVRNTLLKKQTCLINVCQCKSCHTYTDYEVM